MKKHIKRFILNGLTVCGFGPVVLSVVYIILNATGVAHTVAVDKMAAEMLSATLLAFSAGGVVIVYHIERLPLIAAIFIHALVLYLDYTVIYLLNGWLRKGIVPFLIFTSCFVVGFAIIWILIHFSTKRSAQMINSRLTDIQSEDD